MKALTVIVPAFNEEDTLHGSVAALRHAVGPDCQIHIVNDGSTDATGAIASGLADGSTRVSHHPQNRGKTAAIRTALSGVQTRWVVVHDSDREYDPTDLPRLMRVACDRDAVVVLGLRPSLWHRVGRWPFAGGVLLIDVLLWLVHRRWVRDHASCYKLLPTALLRQLDLSSEGFEGCIEIVSKLHRCAVPIVQIPIGYRPRPIAGGKKLSWTFGFAAVGAVWRWRRWSPDPSFDPQVCRSCDE